MSRPPRNHDPLDDFELPPDIMSATLEHAISDDATMVHELGHAVAAKLAKALKGSTVDFGFPGIVTVHLKSGAVARCGGPSLGWMIDVERKPGAETVTIELDIPDSERDAERIAEGLAKALKRW
jgi:hypothetical protein